MQFTLALPVLALIAQVLAVPVPAIVTQTEVVYVTAAAPEAEATPAPRVGNVVEVIVSKLVQIRGDSTNTLITTFTKEQAFAPTDAPAPAPAPTSAPAPSPVAAEVSIAAPSAAPVQSIAAAAAPEASTPSTTVLAPSPEPTTTEEAPAPTTAAASPTTAEASSATDGFSEEILAAHNQKRAEWGSDPLTWSSELASYAQAYADNYDCSGGLTHSGGPYGENLALGYSTTGAVDAWYSEKSDYNPQSPVASHFTQVVWKSTTQVGCGYKKCNNIWNQYTICSYNPAGNFGGQYAANV